MWVEMSYNKYRYKTMSERLRTEEDNYDFNIDEEQLYYSLYSDEEE